HALQSPTSAAAVETEGHLQQALRWLPAIDDEWERAFAELRLNNLLIQVVMTRRGYRTDVAQMVQRCQELSQKLGESSTSGSTMAATLLYHHRLGYRREARALAERLVAPAERSRDPTHLIWVLSMLGVCLLFEGRLVESQRWMERALS